MAGLNPNYDNTITLFNCLKGADNPDGTSDVWYRTVLPECFFKAQQTAVTTGTSAQMSAVYVARIAASTRYRPYAEWVKIPAASRGQYFTGNIGDVIILGESSETISNASPNTATQVITRNKPNAFKVTAFSDNGGAMQRHYRFGG